MTVSDSQEEAAAAANPEGRVTRSKSRVGQPLLPPNAECEWLNLLVYRL